MISCSNNIYKDKISDMLCVQDVNIISSKRFESHAVGEWYVLERYILSRDAIIRLEENKDIKVCDIKRHPQLEDYYWIGWSPTSIHSAMYNILLESAHFHSDNILVREYEKCCHSGACYYTVLVRDSAEFHNLDEKTAVVFDIRKNTIYICNYHY